MLIVDAFYVLQKISWAFSDWPKTVLRKCWPRQAGPLDSEQNNRRPRTEIAIGRGRGWRWEMNWNYDGSVCISIEEEEQHRDKKFVAYSLILSLFFHNHCYQEGCWLSNHSSMQNHRSRKIPPLRWQRLGTPKNYLFFFLIYLWYYYYYYIP